MVERGAFTWDDVNFEEALAIFLTLITENALRIRKRVTNHMRRIRHDYRRGAESQ